MVNYKEASKRPFTNLVKFLIGILLSFVPIVNFLAQGYQLECARTASKKNYVLPEWKDFGNLFVRGLLAIVIGIIYMLPTFILLLIGFGITVLTKLATEEIPTGLFVFSPTIIIAIIVGIISFYIVPMAITNYAMNYKFSAGFDFKKIFKKILTGTYLSAWLLIALYTIVLGVILSFIPWDWVSQGLSSFIIGVTMMTLFGEMYTNIKGGEIIGKEKSKPNKKR